MIFQSLIHSLRERQFRGMRRQTEQLDPQTREHLREFLEDVPEEVQELQQIHEELDAAHVKLAQLLEKEVFVGTRLMSYRTQLRQYQEQQQQQQQQQQQEQQQQKQSDTNSTTEKEDEESSSLSEEELKKKQQEQEQEQEQENYEKHAEALNQIELSHKAMQRGIEVLQERIEILEHRQSELEQMTNECAVVYQTAETLKNMEQQLFIATPPPPGTSELFESVHFPSEDGKGAAKDEDDAAAAENETKTNDNKDEEQGELELELAEQVIASPEPSVVAT